MDKNNIHEDAVIKYAINNKIDTIVIGHNNIFYEYHY